VPEIQQAYYQIGRSMAGLRTEPNCTIKDIFARRWTLFRWIYCKVYPQL